MNELLIELKRPFPVDKVHWRIGSKSSDEKQGLVFAYIDARDVMKRLDDVVPFKWQDRYTHAGSGIYVCEIGIKIEEEWMWRANGAGETAFEAEKGGLSDAFKRAAVMWGIGQYLYKIPSIWTNITKAGRDFKINRTPDLPDWATPEGYDRLVNRQRPVNEKIEKEYEDLLLSDDILSFYALHNSLTEAQYKEITKNFPHGKVTEYKRLVADKLSKGRDEMLEVATRLEFLIEEGDQTGIGEIMEDVDGELLRLIKNNLSPQANMSLEEYYG